MRVEEILGQLYFLKRGNDKESLEGGYYGGGDSPRGGAGEQFGEST